MWKAQLQKIAERVGDDGTLVFRENRDYFLVVPEAETTVIEPFPYLTRYGETPIYRLNFGNHLGIFEWAGVKIKVESTKINDGQFMMLLEEVSAYLVNLPFSYQGGGGGFVKTRFLGKGILYQIFMYIYSLLRQKQIQGIISQIISNPYIKYEKVSYLHRVEEIRGSGYGTIKQIINNPRYLVKLAAGSGLRETQLSHKLNGMFPEKIRATRLCGYIDNPENQFCKYFLLYCQDITNGLQETTANSQIHERTNWVLTEIKRLLNLEFFQHISGLRKIPFSSQVLQKRTAYKELFIIYNRLNQLIRVDDNKNWKEMIELKDAAQLYEYWSFFKLCQAVGKPIKSIRTKTNPLQVELPYGLKVLFPQKIKVFYNKTYRFGENTNQSYSVTLRPDIVLQVKDEIYVFDAKFKLDKIYEGVFQDADDEENETGSGTTFKKEDIYKMHTYRDAIRGCRGAYVLYPGNETRIFPVDGDEGIDGVGAVSCSINGVNRELKEVIEKIVGE
ncbi:MAG TPA: hypothetical protein DC024_00470 [Clostridiales bacterium]|jgi:hypothetical protein|nr:hypothetical protein [Clostridiales bacterium]